MSNEIVCFTELFFFGGIGLIFWFTFYHPLRHQIIPYLSKKYQQNSQLALLGGIGLLAAVANMVFCQYAVAGSFELLFGCVNPADKILDVSLTNNIGGNLLCYTALVWRIKKDQSPAIATPKLTSVSQAEVSSRAPLDYLFLSARGGNVRVPYTSITHLSVQNNALTIHSLQGKFVRYESLKSFASRLPKSRFRQVHRSTVINLDHLMRISSLSSGDAQLTLTGGAMVRGSRRYKANWQ